MNSEKHNVSVIWSTPDPANIVAMAANQAIKRIPKAESKNKSAGLPFEALIRFLYRAEHGSPLEHAVLCMQITGVSRAFMAQITRHRLVSFSCSSQHYQDYSEYPVIEQEYTDQMEMVIEEALMAYTVAVDKGMPKDKARMVLPEAMTVNMIMTANAREWAAIMHQRLCMRNTAETLSVARSMYRVLYDWFPQLFVNVGPQCHEGQCKQGKMSCIHNMVQVKL